jgi:cephalosporin hydroxylase
VSKHVVELGTGGGDQSTLALLIGNPKSLDCFDISPPGSLPTIERLADESGVAFEFHCEDTTKAEGIQSDLLLVDSLHTAAQVEAELAIFAPLCSKRIVFHDVISFGDHGQTDKPDQGINLAIARFLYKHPEWSVERYSEEDNGLLTLRRGCT